MNIQNNIKVVKLGGSSIGEPGQLTKALLRLKQIDASRLFLVVSAFELVTSKLNLIVNFAKNEEVSKAKSILEELNRFHKSFVPNDCKLLAPEFEKANNIVNGIAKTKNCSDRTRDKFLAIGESLSLIIITKYAKEYFSNPISISAQSWILTNNAYSNAKPILLESAKNLSSIVNSNLSADLIITEGFVGKSTEGHISTMGFESSNMTALLAAIALNNDTLDLITPVDGIYNSDPKLFSNALHVPKLNFDDSMILADANLKLLYYDMIELAEKRNIKINIMGLNSDNNTIISSDSESILNEHSFLIVKENLSQYKMDSFSENFLEQLNNYRSRGITFELFDSPRHNYCYMDNSINPNFSVLQQISGNYSLVHIVGGKLEKILLVVTEIDTEIYNHFKYSKELKRLTIAIRSEYFEEFLKYLINRI